MYDIIFYENENGYSELYENLQALRIKSQTSKNERIQFKQIVLCIELLKQQGTKLPTNICKHLINGIYELRPGNNRILYFYYKNNTFVLLHMFRKKTQKTPKEQIEKAKREMISFIKRGDEIGNENMGRL